MTMATTTLEDNHEHDYDGPFYSRRAVVLIFLVPALGGALFGYDIGATSYAIDQLQNVELSGVPWGHILRDSPAWQGIIVSAASLGAVLGTMMVFQVADTIGRRQELRIGSILYLVGATLEWWSSYWPGVGAISILIGGRLVFGVGIGICMHAAPTYLAEMGPSQIRGIMISLQEAAIVTGLLLGYTVGLSYLSTPGGWAYVYRWSGLGAISMFVLSLAIPRSARWLMLHDHREEALQALQFVYHKQFALIEYERILQQTRLVDSTREGSHALVTDVSFRAPFVAALGLVCLQQITGQPSVLSYAAPIFEDAGLSKFASVLVAAFKLAATMSAALAVERFGRKKLLFAGISLMMGSLSVLAVSVGRQSSVAETTVLLSMFLYIGGYQLSFGPVTWLVVSEVFPLAVRGQAVAIAVQVNFFLNALVQFAVPVLSSAIGLNSTFAVFSVMCAYSLYFVQTLVPETMGLDLEQIEHVFQAMVPEKQRTGERKPLVQQELQLVPNLVGCRNKIERNMPP